MKFLIKLKCGIVIKAKFAVLVQEEKSIHLEEGIIFTGQRLEPECSFVSITLKIDEILETTLLKDREEK